MTATRILTSKLVPKLPRGQPKSLVCKLLGSPDTKSVDVRRGSDVGKLQRQLKKQFGSKVKARDLKLFPALDKLSDRWLSVNDKAVDALSKGETSERIEEMLHARSESGFHTSLRKLFDLAPQEEEGVVHILAKECPVHHVLAARWKAINRTVKDQLPTWRQLYKDVYAPQLELYKELAAAVDTQMLDELASTLTVEPGKQMNDLDRKLCLSKMIFWRTHEHPDLSYARRVLLDSSRVDYHVFGPSAEMYREQTTFVAGANCDDIKEGIARVLTALEVVADNNESHEVCGAVMTKDHRWIFLRSLDDKILIDDATDNRFQWDEDGRPDREKLTKLIGKLHGTIMTNVPAADTNWREKEESETRRLCGDDEDDEDDDGDDEDADDVE